MPQQQLAWLKFFKLDIIGAEAGVRVPPLMFLKRRLCHPNDFVTGPYIVCIELCVCEYIATDRYVPGTIVSY